jgi:hypothetical protein
MVSGLVSSAKGKLLSLDDMEDCLESSRRPYQMWGTVGIGMLLGYSTMRNMALGALTTHLSSR